MVSIRERRRRRIKEARKDGLILLVLAVLPVFLLCAGFHFIHPLW